MELLNLESLAEKTSPEFADYVRTELEWHSKEHQEIFIIVEKRCGTRKSKKFDKVMEAELLLRASSICYRFSWRAYERDGHCRQYHHYQWMIMVDIEKFAKSDQRHSSSV